ncbi:hypothetical protein DPMN_143570 [Dreissena polymorpha]|uniref:Uncharacterized protein n=1 Tax=Dreissena polymorpha TaxID=45954 RepID=A0A9D4GGG7_DREPO|nr:hypothetical protein DPMN_143570 [Dreissena polymorpha]
MLDAVEIFKLMRLNDIFLKVNEVVEEVTLVLQVFLDDYCAVEDLLHCTPPSSECSLPFGQQFLSLNFQSIKDDA